MLKFFVVHKEANMKTGGPAFPLQAHDWHKEVSDRGYVNHDFTMGMTLRDYFAAKAMQALAQENYFDATARQAYMIADAMLREREK
jgi:hypothetical protein